MTKAPPEAGPRLEVQTEFTARFRVSVPISPKGLSGWTALTVAHACTVFQKWRVISAQIVTFSVPDRLGCALRGRRLRWAPPSRPHMPFARWLRNAVAAG